LCNPYHGRLSSFLIEQPNLSGVKRTMNRARVILALLLPALWLAASANCLVDPVGAGAEFDQEEPG